MLQFGTEIRSQWQSQLVYGSSTLHSSSKAGQFPHLSQNMWGHTATVWQQELCAWVAIFGRFEPIPLISSVATRYMGTSNGLLWSSQCPEQQTHAHFYGRNRHRLASHHACWLAPPPSGQSWHFWFGPVPLETGLVEFLANCSHLSNRVSFLSKGLDLDINCHCR